jgi:hypothetical protein
MAYQTIVPAKTISTGKISSIDQSNKLVLLSDGNYLSYWESSEPTALNTVGVVVPTVTEATRGQLISLDGTLIGSSFLISPVEYIGTLHSEVVALANGQFAVVYSSTKPPSSVESSTLT